MKNLAKKQVRFFTSKNFLELPTAAGGTSIIVTHGGFLRRLLLQTVIYKENSSLYNPHPRNAEAFLCEIASVEQNDSEVVKAIFIWDQQDPSNAAVQALREALGPHEVNGTNNQFDAGARCEIIGHGSCEFWNSGRCDRAEEPVQLTRKSEESDLISGNDVSFENSYLERPRPSSVAGTFAQNAGPLSEIPLSSAAAATSK